MISHDSNDERPVAVRHGFQFSLRALLILITLVSFLIGGLVWFKKKVDDFNVAILVGNPGPIATQEQWPRALKELVEKAADNQINIEIMDVHCIQSGWDEEYVWRMKSNPSLIDFMKKECEMAQTDPPKWSIFGSNSVAHVTEREIPRWPLPELKNSDYFACPRFMAREPSDRFEMICDTKNSLLVVHYYFDF